MSYALTESGRVLDFSPMETGGMVREWTPDGWVEAVDPVSADDWFNARSLTKEEFAKILKSRGGG